MAAVRGDGSTKPAVVLSPQNPPLWRRFALNYYPPCPQPDLTYGLPGHSDLNLITILLQADDVSGLQVSKDGKWIAVDPVPNTFIINVGDQIQVYNFFHGFIRLSLKMNITFKSLEMNGWK